MVAGHDIAVRRNDDSGARTCKHTLVPALRRDVDADNGGHAVFNGFVFRLGSGRAAGVRKLVRRKVAGLVA